MTLKPAHPVPAVVAELQSLQRQRAVVLKSRIMQENRLRAVVAGTLGYSNAMAEKDRRQKFKEAAIFIREVARGGHADYALRVVVEATLRGIDSFNWLLKDGPESLEKQMLDLAKRLPVAEWVRHPDRRGFGLLSLATVIGETGDLSNYRKEQAKGYERVWKRLGCAPYTFRGKTAMGATWRGGKEGKLPAEAWEDFGYSPWRRSIAYLIGENLVKLNFVGKASGEFRNGNESGRAGQDILMEVSGEDYLGDECKSAGPHVLLDVSGETGFGNDAGCAGHDMPRDGAGEPPIGNDTTRAGPYRKIYDEAKARAAATHPEWTRCPACEGKGKSVKGGKCSNCKGTGVVLKRCHLHGMLLATKALLKDLWREWNRVVQR